jgi:hypothetical protein
MSPVMAIMSIIHHLIYRLSPISPVSFANFLNFQNVEFAPLTEVRTSIISFELEVSFHSKEFATRPPPLLQILKL